MNDDLIIENENPSVDLADENLALKAELSELKASIERSRKQESEMKELSELFPGVTADDIPSEVYEYQKTHGATLASSFAIYHRRKSLEKERAEKRALENVLKTPGALGGASSSERLFTSEEIRSMDREQVRRNYKQIMKSLKYGK